MTHRESHPYSGKEYVFTVTYWINFAHFRQVPGDNLCTVWEKEAESHPQKHTFVSPTEAYLCVRLEEELQDISSVSWKWQTSVSVLVGRFLTMTTENANEYPPCTIIMERCWAINILLPSRKKKKTEKIPKEKHEQKRNRICWALSHIDVVYLTKYKSVFKNSLCLGHKQTRSNEGKTWLLALDKAGWGVTMMNGTIWSLYYILLHLRIL